MSETRDNPTPVKAGDVLDGRTVLAVEPYTGRYPHWFNCVLVLSSPCTRSGRIERAYWDPAGRPSGAE